MRCPTLCSVALLATLLGCAIAIEEHSFCRDLTCANKDQLLSVINSLRSEIAEKDALAADSNCTACYSNPCLNGGTCMPNGKTGFKCDCPDWTAGAYCQKNISCTPFSCGNHASCYVANHQTNCVCDFGYSGNPVIGCKFKSQKICFNGDPHYVTFDGAYYDYQSTCPYLFSQPCNGSLGQGYHYFSVKAKNELLHPGDTVSYVESCQVEMYNQTIYVDDKLRVYVNNLQVHIPWYYPSQAYPKISVTLRGRDIVIKNDELVEVDFTNGQLCLVVPDVDAFRGPGTLCGLAGNLDGKCTDDLRKPDGTVIPLNNGCRPKQSQSDEFGDSWRTLDYTSTDPSQACVDGWTMTNRSRTCDVNSAVADCQAIFNAQVGKGPFKNCAKLGNDTIMMAYDSCLYDVCRDPKLKCPSMVDFVHMCQFQVPEADVTGWRQDPTTMCQIVCPDKSGYTTCVSACPATCASHDAPDACDAPCSEGCACQFGYVLDTSNPYSVSCIPVEQCGCADPSGNFHPPSDPWLTNQCTQTNECKNGTFNQAPYACSAYGHCDIVDNKYACKCDIGFEGNGVNCTDINECLDPTTCNANVGHGTCINTIGSYQCVCNQFFDGHDCEKYAPKRHCADLHKYWGVNDDGAQTVYPPLNGKKDDSSHDDDPANAKFVYCDMTTDGGGWTLVGNTITNNTANRTLAEYAAGFGDVTGQNAWLGLDLLNFYTNYQPSSLRLNLYRCTHNGVQAKWTDCTYDSFAVMGKETGYQVNIPKVCHGSEVDYYDGWARWDLTKPGPKFLAFDIDDSTAHCSSTFRNTGWWFDTSYRCGPANLNGVRYSCDSIPVGVDAQTYLFWNGDPINQAQMWLRPFNYPNYDPNGRE